MCKTVSQTDVFILERGASKLSPDVISLIGILLGLAVLIILSFRGYNPLVVGPVAAVVVILFSGMEVMPSLLGAYMESWAGFAKGQFLLFLASAIFGKILGDSGAARVIANWLLKLVKKFPGKERYVVVYVHIFLIMLLTYGGFSLFTLIFFLVHIFLPIYKELDIPWELYACQVMGTSTITQGFLPGTPAIQNLIPMEYLGTTATAAPLLGVITSIMMLVLGFIIVYVIVRRTEKKQMGFLPVGAAAAAAYLKDGEGSPLDNLPQIPVLVCFLPSIVLLVAMNVFKVQAVLSMVLAIAVAYLLFCIVYKQKVDFKDCCAVGANQALGAVAYVCAIVGFGGVVAASPGFAMVVNALQNLPGPPVVQVAVGVAICAGITGSGSGGVGLAMANLAEGFMAQGVDPQIIHRLTAIASCSLDSLPHCGSLQSSVAIQHTPLKTFYYIIGWISVAGTTVMLAVATILASFGIV